MKKLFAVLLALSMLGYVVDAGFDEIGVAKYAVLEPAADFDSLEQVFVLVEYENG